MQSSGNWAAPRAGCELFEVTTWESENAKRASNTSVMWPGNTGKQCQGQMCAVVSSSKAVIVAQMWRRPACGTNVNTATDRTSRLHSSKLPQRARWAAVQ